MTPKMKLHKIEELFDKYSYWCDFEDGDRELFLDKETFKDALLEFSKETVTNGVYNYLDCSTAHITQEDDADLYLMYLHPTACDTTLIVSSCDNGYFVCVPDEEELFDSISESLQQVLRKAIELNCIWVKLDADGTKHEDLKTYEW